jgi:hypothetical protein
VDDPKAAGVPVVFGSLPPLPPKDVEDDDPMLLEGIALPGDTQDAMAEAFVEEFMLMGYGDELLLKVFQTPYYTAAHRVLLERGEPFVKDLIARVRGGYGAQMRFAVKDAEVDHA